VFELTNTGFVICYVAGTQITTPEGEVSVEQLAVGGKVLTLHGEARRVVWIGAGRVLATRGRRSAATPVIVRKGALADNVPHHDLRVTKGHSLYIDGVLIPVEFLVNHRSIIWGDHAQEVRLYHIGLGMHDVLLPTARRLRATATTATAGCFKMETADGACRRKNLARRC
jgi:Hint domain